MMSTDDDLDRLLRGGCDPGDARVADLLRSLRAQGHQPTPPASEPLAAFLAQRASGLGSHRAHAEVAMTQTASQDTRVTLGAPRASGRRVPASIRLPLQRVARLGLVAKVMLGASLALGGATAVAATGLPPGGPDDTVVTTPGSHVSSVPAHSKAGAPDEDRATEKAHTHGVRSPAAATGARPGNAGHGSAAHAAAGHQAARGAAVQRGAGSGDAEHSDRGRADEGDTEAHHGGHQGSPSGDDSGDDHADDPAQGDAAPGDSEDAGDDADQFDTHHSQPSSAQPGQGGDQGDQPDD
jgi:hypothetical protein